MRIELRGLFTLGQVYEPAGNLIKLEGKYEVVTNYEQQAWNALKEAGLDKESVVEVTPSEVSSNPVYEKAPYAIVTHNNDSTKQLRTVITYLQNAGLNVEVPPPIHFYQKK